MSKTPEHYLGDRHITCADALKSMVRYCGLPPIVAYWWGCAFKYVWRWPYKNGADDIDKAIDCLQKLKEEALDKNLTEEESRVWMVNCCECAGFEDCDADIGSDECMKRAKRKCAKKEDTKEGSNER